MLQIDVIAVGKLKERFWQDACAEYAKRLGGYAKLSVRENLEFIARIYGCDQRQAREKADRAFPVPHT